MIHTNLCWGVTVILALSILYLSVRPSNSPDRHIWDMPARVATNDPATIAKWRHGVAYATLSASLACATAPHLSSPLTHGLVVITSATVYGIVIEVLQIAIPSRQFSITDIIANFIGTTVVLPFLVL